MVVMREALDCEIARLLDGFGGWFPDIHRVGRDGLVQWLTVEFIPGVCDNNTVLYALKIHAPRTPSRPPRTLRASPNLIATRDTGTSKRHGRSPSVLPFSISVESNIEQESPHEHQQNLLLSRVVTNVVGASPGPLPAQRG
jgi:hypothetical protein